MYACVAILSICSDGVNFPILELRDELKEIKEGVDETKQNVKDLADEMEEIKIVLQTNQQSK